MVIPHCPDLISLWQCRYAAQSADTAKSLKLEFLPPNRQRGEQNVFYLGVLSLLVLFFPDLFFFVRKIYFIWAAPISFRLFLEKHSSESKVSESLCVCSFLYVCLLYKTIKALTHSLSCTHKHKLVTSWWAELICSLGHMMRRSLDLLVYSTHSTVSQVTSFICHFSNCDGL